MRIMQWIVCLTVCVMPFCNAQAADDASPATRPAVASPLEQLRADMDDFLAAARRGDRATVLKYIGVTHSRGNFGDSINSRRLIALTTRACLGRQPGFLRIPGRTNA